MNQHLIGNRSSYVREYVVNGLVEQQMVILAAIIRDLDHETARTETGRYLCIYLIIIQCLHIHMISTATKHAFHFRHYIGILRCHTGHYVFRIFSSFESLHA